MESNYSLSDLVAVMGGGERGMGGLGMGGVIILIILFLFFFMRGSDPAAAVADYATKSDLTNAIAAQTSALNQQGILISSQNNNYETSRQLSDLQMSLMNQNNTNLVNAIQGFNVVNQNLTAGFNMVNQSICNLGYQLDKCCCDIKTQMLQNRLDDAQATIVSQRGDLSNANQTQVILGTMGRWVGYPPVAAAAATAA